ncbi:MAG: sulfotransferase [Myxococcota bacterium]
MHDQLFFLIGSPRSGSTLLARMLGVHSQIHAPDEPHLLTPLAHLGYYASVEKAPYDPFITAAAMRELVSALPQGERDYLDALRAYTDSVYARLLSASGCHYLLDKTPAYALVLDFAARLYPAARYIVLTRHPMAIWCSYAESFFDGDYLAAHAHNHLLERYVPAIGRFLREKPVPLCHVQYEQLVQEPEQELKRICEFTGISFEPGMVNYGDQASGAQTAARGLGDPMTVTREKRPTTTSLSRWAQDLNGEPERIELCGRILDALTDDDLTSWGYVRSEIEAELDAAAATGGRPRRRPLNLHTLERRSLVLLRRNIHHNAFGRLVTRIRMLCDTLLR